LDGLRLALIIFGIVVVALVYFWTARRRRLDREAGDFDRFDAWADEELDPLAPTAINDTVGVRRDAAPVDYASANAAADELTQENNLPLADIEGALVSARDPQALDARLNANQQPSVGQMPMYANRDSTVGDDGMSVVTAQGAAGAALDEVEVIDGLEAIVDSLGESSPARAEPSIGSLEDVKVQDRHVQPTIRDTVDASAVKVEEPFAGMGAGRNDYAKYLEDGGDRDVRDELHASAEMVVVLNVMAHGERTFAGLALKAALEGAGLKSGDMQLYHYRAETQSDDAPPIFSALNAVKPGTLDAQEFDGMHTPGVALILRMPGLDRPSEAFELMLIAARRMAEELNGQVCDGSRSTLTGQALNHLREQIAAVAFSLRSGR
jgi:cell division protein ZipA